MRDMKVRVINFDDFAEYCDKNNLDIYVTDITDEMFMEIYNEEDAYWEFDSLESFQTAFNTDDNSAPTPTSQIIRFFPNE